MACTRSESIFCWPRACTGFLCEERLPVDAVRGLVADLVVLDLVVADFVEADFVELADVFAVASLGES